MLVQDYDLDIFTPPCHPGAERYSAIARLTTDISGILPYLNATLPGAVFHQAAPALIWKKGAHKIAFHSYEIATSNVEDRVEAEKEIDELIVLVNHTWEQRDKIVPNFETRQRPVPMAVYKLLPQTNCKQCGEPTCFSFALKLVAAQRKLIDCPALCEAQYADNLAALQEMIIDAPEIG